MEKQDIIDFYKDHSFEETATNFKMGKKKLNTYFEHFNIPKKTKGRQNVLIKNYDDNYRYDFYKEKLVGKNKIEVKCKQTGEIFNDWFNEGGFLSSHLRTLNVDVPALNDRRNFQKETGLLWWEQYFDYTLIKIDTIKCELCGWETIDVDNKSGCFKEHLKNSHEISLDEYCEIHNVDFKVLKIKKEKENFLKIKDNTTMCLVCQQKMKIVNTKHLKKHGLTMTQYKEMFPEGKTVSNEYRERLTEHLHEIGKNIEFTKVSKPHQEIMDILLENGVSNIVINDRKVLNGKELDIYLPDHNLAIEMDGLKHHTELFGSKTSTYHLDKTKSCQSKGIRLLHIFDDEWMTKKDICISKLLSILKVSKNQSIYARKCIIREISSEVKNDFLNKNHIQGEDRSNIKLGMFHNDILVSVMTFSNSFNMTNTIGVDGQWNLSRFASDNLLNVIGGAGKLLSYFIKNYIPKSIISFADLRWSEMKDNLYIKLGFNLVKIGDPNYFYYHPKLYGNVRVHKFAWGKKSILKKYPEINPNKTEWEMMQELGFDRVWDCGLLKYELIIS